MLRDIYLHSGDKIVKTEAVCCLINSPCKKCAKFMKNPFQITEISYRAWLNVEIRALFFQFTVKQTK